MVKMVHTLPALVMTMHAASFECKVGQVATVGVYKYVRGAAIIRITMFSSGWLLLLPFLGALGVLDRLLLPPPRLGSLSACQIDRLFLLRVRVLSTMCFLVLASRLLRGPGPLCFVPCINTLSTLILLI